MKGELPIEKSDIFCEWGYRKAYQYDSFEYWIHADIVKMTIIDEPIRYDDFFVQADIQVHFRLKNLSSNEIIEKSFKAYIGYEREIKTYFFLYWPPNKHKKQGFILSNITSKQTFGQTIGYANSQLKKEADLLARYLKKRLFHTQQPA